MKFKLFFLLVSIFSYSSYSEEGPLKASDFTLTAAEGNAQVSLSDFAGKIIVLEWLNHGCPFIRKHYDGKNMQKLQEKYTKKGVVWLSVISSAPGKQGFVDAEKALKEKSQYGSKATHILLDPTGKVGKLYGAKTTPHMFIINKNKEIAYQGAIDDQADAEISSLSNAKNFVALALDELLAGKEVSVQSTKAYGCSVKYQ